ncbi:MAG: HAD-IC family P-type ATPase [Pirellulaceae bacterium]
MSGEENRESIAETISIRNPHTLPAAQLLTDFDVGVDVGLNAEQVRASRQKFGENRIQEQKPPSVWFRLARQFRELVVLILIAAAVISAILGEWVDTYAILAIVVLNGLLGFIQEERASRALAALRGMAAPKTKVRRSGKLTSIPVAEIVPGDIVILEAGDQIPADARLLHGFDVSTQEAALTGESQPVAKSTSDGLNEATALADRSNMLYMGTSVVHGEAVAVVTGTGMNTELGTIAELLVANDDEQTPLQRRLAELGRLLIVVCLVMVSIVFGIQYFRGEDFFETLLVSVSLAVAAVPEGLPAVVTIALALGLQRMVRRNVLVRRLPSVETLGSVTTICSDKTGTLTRNEMTVREVVCGGRKFHVTGAGYTPDGKFIEQNPSRTAEPVEITSEPVLQAILNVARSCSKAEVVRSSSGDWNVVGDPTEGALVALAMKGSVDRIADTLVFEIPFDSERKAMSVVRRNGEGSESLHTKGAPEVVLAMCRYEMQVDGDNELDDTRREQILQVGASMAQRALRVMAFAHTSSPIRDGDRYLEQGLTFLGLIGMMDPPRQEIGRSIQECHEAGIRPIMITGDHPSTAMAIAMELGLAAGDSSVISGADLDLMPDGV